MQPHKHKNDWVIISRLSVFWCTVKGCWFMHAAERIDDRTHDVGQRNGREVCRRWRWPL